MSVLYTNESLTIKNMLYSYPHSTIDNLLEKLSFSTHTDETSVDILKQLARKEIDEVNTTIATTNITYNNELLKAIPLKYWISKVNNEVYLFTIDNVYTMSDTVYNDILNSSKEKHINDCSEIELDNTYGTELNDESYILFTDLYTILQYTTIPIPYIFDIGPDTSSELRYLHIEVPTVSISEILNNISGYKIYFSNSKTDRDIYLPQDVIDGIFTIDINTISSNHLRYFIWFLRTLYKHSDMSDSNIARSLLNTFRREIASEYRSFDIEQLYVVFPSLRDIPNFNNMEITKLTIVGNKSDMVITTTTDDTIIKNILTKLLTEL